MLLYFKAEIKAHSKVKIKADIEVILLKVLDHVNFDNKCNFCLHTKLLFR